MVRTPTVALPIPEPIALLEATLLLVIQVLITQHPDLLAPPEEPAPRTPGLSAARRIFEAVRELHVALDTYRVFLPDTHPLALSDDHANDDFPF